MNRTFTPKLFSVMLFAVGIYMSNAAFAQDEEVVLNPNPGTGWATINPTEPLVINEKFQGFKHFHSDSTTDMGNSDNAVDEFTGETIPGYMDLDTSFLFTGSKSWKVYYDFDTCAFAPTWKAAYAFRDTVENTSGVSNGFVEISRKHSSGTKRGYFTVDLRELDFVEAIQYSHSSTGGNKRGLTVQYSIDNGETWDSLRYQAGSSWSASFSTDIFTKERTVSPYNCQLSAYGLLWEDAIYSENLMLRFLESVGQTVRLHDLKVYASLKPDIIDAANRMSNADFAIRIADKQVMFSKTADVEVYNMAGVLMKSSKNAKNIFIGDMPNGVFIIKATSDGFAKCKKIVIR